LLQTTTGATIITPIQKFQSLVDDGSDLFLNDTDDIFVLIDESQFIIFANNNDRLKKYHLAKEQQKHYIERFKKPLCEDKLALIVVYDMLRTGLNAPAEQVMYLGKPLKENYMLQVIARTNRTYDKKTYDLIVDYYGVSAFLNQALAIFNPKDI
jgi:type I restriction enzyme, R subunit